MKREVVVPDQKPATILGFPVTIVDKEPETKGVKFGTPEEFKQWGPHNERGIVCPACLGLVPRVLDCKVCTGYGRVGAIDEFSPLEIRLQPIPADPAAVISRAWTETKPADAMLPGETADEYIERKGGWPKEPERKPPELPPIPEIQTLREDHEPTPENFARDRARYERENPWPVWGFEYQYDGAKFLINIAAPTAEQAAARLVVAGTWGKCVGELKGSIPADRLGAGLFVRVLCAVRNFFRG